MLLIYRTNRFNRCLDALHQGGGDAAIAVRRAERMIREMSRGNSANLEQRWKTRNGEARIDGCRKFYLGHRFRLICIRQEQQVLFAFAGPHDECDRWIEKNRGRDFSSLAVAADDCAGSLAELAAAVPPSRDTSEPGPETDYEAFLRDRISERELRTFLGAFFG